MTSSLIKKVVVVGGGTAGWISAALLVRLLGRNLDITLVESDDIGTVGVGEATIPPILALNNALGIDEAEFMRATGATIKLGIQFENWGKIGDSYMHAFGGIGKDYPFCRFHHLWNRHRQLGATNSYWDYSLNYQAALAGRFGHVPGIEGTDLDGLTYAYHFDAGKYAMFLSRYAQSRGVKRVEGLIEHAPINSETGDIKSVVLKTGECIEGDFFIDCSGFRGLLIEQALHSGFDDWSHYLPCDRAIAVPSTSTAKPKPYTRSIAHSAGWQWQIPLQHRVGNGLVYCSRYLSDEQARDVLLANIEGEALAQPKPLRFTTGRRRRQWVANCVAVGLSSGFLEPLESTSIHLIQSAMLLLIKHFPHRGISADQVALYNQLCQEEFEQVRDFIILHYHLNNRKDEPFWAHCARMEIPDSLAQKVELFRQTGDAYCPHEALFSSIAWQQVMIGQGAVPADYHPLANNLSEKQLASLGDSLQSIISKVVARLPSHSDFLQQYCKIKSEDF